jgi:hypothetical protein
MAKQPRPGINPATIRCRTGTEPNAPQVNLTITRTAVAGSPHDGPQRVGRDRQQVPTVGLVFWDGPDTSPG